MLAYEAEIGACFAVCDRSCFRWSSGIGLQTLSRKANSGNGLNMDGNPVLPTLTAIAL